MKTTNPRRLGWLASMVLLGGLGGYAVLPATGRLPELPPGRRGSEAPFTFDRLKGEKLKFSKQTVAINQPAYYGDRLISFGAAVEKKATLLRLKIKDKPLLYHYCNDSLQQLNKNNQPEYISYSGQKVNLDYLLSHNSNRVKMTTKTFVLFDGTFYNFSFRQHDYLLLHAQQRVFYRNVLYYYLILLELAKGKVVHSYAFVDAPETTPACFGDFNSDGYLDYIDWRKKEPRISLFSLKETGFVRDEQHYIMVKPSQAQQEYSQRYDDLFNYDEIDKTKSKWFYSL